MSRQLLIPTQEARIPDIALRGRPIRPMSQMPALILTLPSTGDFVVPCRPEEANDFGQMASAVFAAWRRWIPSTGRSASASP